jgi:hypothetical protein
VTIADSKYIFPLHHLQKRLDKFGYGQDLVVLCLDDACAEDESFHGWAVHLDPAEQVMYQVASMKVSQDRILSLSFLLLYWHHAGFLVTLQSLLTYFPLQFTISMQLLENGYDFVFLDGDVYLTGSRDPFLDMLPLSNSTWDIQFQKDFELPSKDLNIGWYFARASPSTQEFFRQSHDRWLETREWDQSVMNEIARKMEESSSLNVHRLELSRFCNFMLEAWEERLFGDEQLAAEFVEESAVVHYTCVEQSVKTYFGANFGGLTDLDDYYSLPPPLLGTANIAGTSEAIRQQLAFALDIAERTGRTIIWPERVSIVQQRVDEETGERQFYSRLNFPGVRVVSLARAQESGIDVVEGRYLQNQQREVEAPPSMPVGVDIAEYLEHIVPGRPESLTDFVQGLEPYIVPMLDFGNLMPPSHGWLREEHRQEKWYHLTSPEFAEHFEEAVETFDSAIQRMGIGEYSEQMRDRVHLCLNAEYDFTCLNVCNDP